MTEFKKFATRPSSLAREVPIAFYMTRMGLKRFLTIPIDNEISDYYVEKESNKQMLKNIMDEINKDRNKNLKQYEEYIQLLIEKAKKVFEHCTADGATLWKYYDDYFRFITTYSLYLIGTFSAEEFVIPRIAKAFPKQLALITSPGKPFEYNKMRKALFEKPIEEVQKEYGWMNHYNIHEEEYPISYFEDIKKTLNKKEVEETYAAIEKNQKDFDEFLKTVKDEQLRSDCVLVHEYTFIKTDRVDRWKQAMHYARSLFVRLAQKPGWTIYEAINLAQKEVKKALINDEYPPLEEIKLRSSKKCIIDITDETVKIVTDPKEIAELKKLVYEEISDEQEFKGTIASSGHAQGQVAIVIDKSQLGKVNKGDILVAIWTTPDYIPAMQKAAAIITEEGGMTSHAAVISRELKKPCLLNIKNATKILKDGDKVEVDANHGVVKKI